jgi:hypothetical protein
MRPEDLVVEQPHGVIPIHRQRERRSEARAFLLVVVVAFGSYRRKF